MDPQSLWTPFIATGITDTRILRMNGVVYIKMNLVNDSVRILKIAKTKKHIREIDVGRICDHCCTNLSSHWIDYGVLTPLCSKCLELVLSSVVFTIKNATYSADDKYLVTDKTVYTRKVLTWKHWLIDNHSYHCSVDGVDNGFICHECHKEAARPYAEWMAPRSLLLGELLHQWSLEDLFEVITRLLSMS